MHLLAHRRDAAILEREDMLSKCANPQCDAKLLRLSDGKVFQFETRQIFRASESSFLKGHQVAHYWLCGGCLSFVTLGLKDGAVEVMPLNLQEAESIGISRRYDLESGASMRR